MIKMEVKSEKGEKRRPVHFFCLFLYGTTKKMNVLTYKKIEIIIRAKNWGKLRGKMPKLKQEGKNKKSSPEEVIPRNIARLGPSLFLEGELSGKEDVVIEGQYKGKIDLANHNILVGRGAKVEADIRAKNITIHGTVEGNIDASGKIFISEEGQMKGDLKAPKISIMEGAKFMGGVKIEKDRRDISLPEEKIDILAIKEEDKTEEKTTFELV
jgi:cytoskeletal protein CcmA (bactofilin family)